MRRYTCHPLHRNAAWTLTDLGASQHGTHPSTRACQSTAAHLCLQSATVLTIDTIWLHCSDSQCFLCCSNTSVTS